MFFLGLYTEGITQRGDGIDKSFLPNCRLLFGISKLIVVSKTEITKIVT